MAKYLAMRILNGNLDYLLVAARFPQYAAEIDAILIANGYIGFDGGGHVTPPVE